MDIHSIECEFCLGLQLPKDFDPHRFSAGLRVGFCNSELTTSSKNGCPGCEVLLTCLDGLPELGDTVGFSFGAWGQSVLLWVISLEDRTSYYGYTIAVQPGEIFLPLQV